MPHLLGLPDRHARPGFLDRRQQRGDAPAALIGVNIVDIAILGCTHFEQIKRHFLIAESAVAETADQDAAVRVRLLRRPPGNFEQLEIVLSRSGKRCGRTWRMPVYFVPYLPVADPPLVAGYHLIDVVFPVGQSGRLVAAGHGGIFMTGFNFRICRPYRRIAENAETVDAAAFGRVHHFVGQCPVEASFFRFDRIPFERIAPAPVQVEFSQHLGMVEKVMTEIFGEPAVFDLRVSCRNYRMSELPAQVCPSRR